MTICFWSPPQILFKILFVSAHVKCILKSSLITIIIYNCILLPLVPYKTPTWSFSRGISQHRIKTTYWSINLASILSNIYFLVNRIFKTNKRFFSRNQLFLIWIWKSKTNNFSCLVFSKENMFFKKKKISSFKNEVQYF